MSSLPDPANVIASKSANALAEFGDLSTLAKASMILSDDAATLLIFEALKKILWCHLGRRDRDADQAERAKPPGPNKRRIGHHSLEQNRKRRT